MSTIINLFYAIPVEVLFSVLGALVAFQLFCNGFVASEVSSYHDPYADDVDWALEPFHKKWNAYVSDTFVEGKLTRFCAKSYFCLVTLGAFISWLKEKFTLKQASTDEGSI